MSTRKEKNPRKDEQRAPRRQTVLVLAGLSVLLLATFIFFMLGRKPRDGDAMPKTGAAINPASPVQPDFQKLKGQWQRPDGGYVIDITSIEANGKMQAGYYNPKPIHVAKAEALLEGVTIKVFIELNDVNYPGSTYTLHYDPAADQLQGIYYQALLQQNFEVFFVRIE